MPDDSQPHEPLPEGSGDTGGHADAGGGAGHRPSVEVSPLHRPDRGLAGFLLTGRWPENTREWVQFLTLAVRLAAVPGMVPTTSVYRSTEATPVTAGPPGAVGVVELAGRVVGDGAPALASRSDPPPAALVLLHPPEETTSRTPDVDRPASGCVLLPGLPHLGLEHRAAWVEAEIDGTVTRLIAARGVDPSHDPDTAVLSMLFAA